MDLSEAAPRLEELILSGADLTALNHTSLSLWHFQQLLLDLLPSAETNEREEDQDDVKSLESPEAVATDTPWSGVKLNEGMNVAAALYEHPMNVLKAAIGSQEQTGETLSGTEGVSLQGVTASIKGRMTPDTKVSALFHRFRCVICLDVSPSVLSIDPSSGRLFLDLMYESVELFIWSLLRPMVVGREIFTPELHVSVLVQGALVESLCVVLQGYIVTSTNAASFLQLIKDRFQLIENDWASQAQEQGPGFFFGNASPASLDWILQNAVFALNSLPSDCAPMIIFVTDGVVDVKNFHSYDNLLMQLVRHDIQCHFLHIGGGEYSELNATFGLVPDTNLLRFVATCTGGTIFDYYALHEACYGTTRVSSDRVKKMTCLQESLFLRKSSVHAKSVPIVRLDEIDKTSFDERTLLPLRPYRMWREKVHEYRIFADVNRIVEARLCEGFIINKIRVKTYQPPHLIKRASVQAGIDPISSGGASASSNSGHHDDITKILIVFLLQWKQNVWLEYVISTTTETYAASQSLANAILHTGRRASEHSVKSLRTATAVKAAGTFYCDDQGITWSEWHIKMNILGYADFLRVFEDTMQCSSENRERGAMKEGNTMMASAAFVHDFILNVQDVDRVLLHLMTATASMSETSESVASQYSFGTNSTPAGATPKITSSHPVFNIIGDLSTVLWHRWFFVERFELLAVVKSDACMDLFYRSETHDETHRDSLFSNWSGAGALSQGICHAHDATYGPSNGLNSFGIQNVAETLVAILVKWSSQQLSKTLFLKFLHPNFSVERGHTAPRSIASSSSITCSGGMTHRRRQRTHISIDECANESNGRKSKAALCFVRLEFNNKTLCAVHVAFFATKLSTRREVLNDLKGTIFAGINELAVTSNLSKLLSSSMVETPVILCHRLMSRLLVTHDTLLLEEAGPLDSYANSPAVEAEKSARVNPVSSSCCAGSKLQQHRVFGAYVWHSSWKWKLSNLAALLDAMRRLHCIRISCGFWVLDWKMKEDEAQVESIVFGREIILESENGHVKTALVQYVLRRVSDTCLMTSFWIEPKHGSIKTRLPKQDAKNLKFHWSQRQAIGHCTPLEYYESSRACQSTTVEEGELHENEDCTYLDEGELLHLIGSYIFKSDRHLFSCLNTFDCIIHLRETMESSSQLNKDSRGTVGSNWSLDRQLAAEQGMILPPFSTARLLATSKRSTEHYLMYLQSGRSFVGGVKESKIDAPSVSPANENLYSMLGLTLRGLSDCEVSWTDYYGDVVADSDSLSSRNASDEEGLNGQLPLWLKHHLAVTFKDRVPHHTLSKGKCFAKVVGDDCVVLAFFPSLDTLQVQTKKSSTGDSLKSNDEMESNPPFDKFEMAAGKESKVHTPSQQFSVRSAQEDGSTSRGVRMSVSADDIVLYQERRRGFREGYKSWRMGHYQGSRDEKQSYGRDFQKLRLPSTPEDHELCEEISRQASYGCDFHLLIENAEETFGTGFFQIAFYECSLSRLSTNLHDTNEQSLGREDLAHTILKQLFYSECHEKRGEKRPTRCVDHNRWKTSTASRLSSDSILASCRFRKKIKRAHEHNFSRGVYMALREGGTVQHSDLLQALSSCIEVPVDVDITLLYRVMETAASHKAFPLSPAAAVVSAGIGADVLKDKLTKSFERILSSAFVPIPGTKYYYFTGNENVSYDDLSSSEYDLHVLMEGSDDGETSVESRKIGQEQPSNDASSNNEDYYHVERLNSSSFVNPKGKDDAAERRQGQSKRTIIGRELSDSMISSAEESESEQHHANVEEDAEFNKDVAVATSSLSVPFFLKFECRVLNGSRETRSNSDDSFPRRRTSTDTMLLSRSSSSSMHDDLSTKLVADSHPSSPESRQEEFKMFLESLKTSQGSQVHSTPTDGSHITESLLKMPSGRIALRLVTLTLPNERVFDDGHVPPHAPFVMDNGGSKMAGLPSISHNFSTLHHFQRQVLTHIRKDIKEWSSVEILSILKSADEITPAVGALVQRLFNDLPELAVTKVKYPLEFVAGSHETSVDPLDLFKRELEKGDLLHVHRCNDVYFVVDIQNLSHVDGSGAIEIDVNLRIPYWAFLEVRADHISLQFHHSDHLGVTARGFNRLEILTRLQLGIRAVCRRVNQFLLLLHLHETRTCNGLLLPPNENFPTSPRSPKPRAISQDMSVHPDRFFWPGQFECDLRYSAFFNLHERLAPNFALNMLCTSALEQFQVHNRRHIFVYRQRNGQVFYMKIGIFYESKDASKQSMGDRREISGLNKSNTGGSTANATTMTTPVCGIRLEVFGVSQPGEEITHELCRLLERKLDEATQVVLMKLLARNTKFQLSHSDLTFLCPPATEPSSTIQYVFPTETVDCCKLLSYLSQTLKLAPYIRPVTTSGSLNPSRNVRESANNSLRLTRRGSVASVGSFISFQGEDTAPEQTAAVKCEEDTEGKRSAHIHPAYFGRYSKTFEFPEDNAIISFDPATRSPVFFTERKMEGEVNVVTDTAPAARLVCLPEVLAQASYVLNLNPDLRLAQEFLSRVGKGLAFMRVDFIRETSESKLRQGDDLGSSKRAKQMRDIPGLAELFPVPVNTNATTLMARCQVWIRGSIDTTELSQVVEAFVDEALYDYHIEESIKKLRCSNQCPDASPSYETSPHLSGTPINLPSEVETLMSLFKNACLLPSSSVTNIRVNVSIAPWNIHNVLTQLQSFLSCLPHHLRPAVFAKSKFSDCYEIVSSPNDRTHSNCNTSSDKFRLVVQYTEDREAFDGADSSDSDAETTASISSAIHHIDPLMRTDSTHSEASDNDSVVPLTWASTSAGSDALAVSQLQNLPPVPCTTSSTVGLMGGGLVHAPPRQKGPSLSERAVFLHSKNDNTHAHHSHLQGQDHRDVKRSFYYVVDLSTRKGLRLYGYNMSIGFTESFATHIARVFTWSMLREKLLRSLLLEKSGLSAAAPRGSIVLQPSSLFFNGGKSEQTGKHVGKHCAVVCKDSSVHFIAYCPPVLSILESNKHFPRVLDAGFLSSIEGTSLGIYLREAQTQPAIAVTTSQYQRPRGKSNTNLGVPIGPPSIPELARDFSGPSLSQRSFHSNGDAPSNVLGPTSGRTKSGGIHSNTNMSDSMASSPGKRANGPNSALPFPGGSRGDTVNRMRGGAGAATALMAARERARGGGGFSNRMGTGPLPRAVAGSSSYDSVAPWDLPLPKKKGPRLQTAADDGGPHDARMNPSAVDDAVPTNSRHLVSKNKVSAVDSSLQRGPPAFGRVGVGSLSSASSLSGLTLAKLAMQRRSSNESECLDPGHIHSSWKKRLETSWGPRFMYPGKTERWSIERKKSHELEVGDDRGKCMKSVSPVSFFCGAFEKRWEAFEARSTNHMVGKNLLEKLSSLGAEEELDEPVAKDVVAHLMESGHFVLFQRFRAAFIEGSKPVETINTREDCEHASTRLLALQSCMNLVHLLSYKRKFVFDQEDSWVAKLYSEYTILDMEAGTGADIQGVKQQVVTSLDSLRLKVTSEFYEEYATYLCTLGFRRLATFDATRSHACAFPVESTAATSENNVPGREGFSHYFFCPEKIAAEGSEWKMELREGSASVSVLILEVKCDDRGVRLTAVLTSVHDLEQQDLRFQSHLAPRLGHGRTSGSRLQSVIAWMRRQVQTQSLIYEFTIRYFQQCILQWIKATHELRDRQEGHGSTGGNHIPDVETSEVSSRHPATFQHAVKGLQCFLDAFPTPPVEKTKTPKAVTRKDETVSAKFNDRFSSSALGKTHHRSTSRRFARPRAAARLHRPASLKDTTPLSLLSHDCVLRVATVTLRPTSLQSSCSKVILATILLRYIACHGLRYEVVDLLQFGTPDAVVCHSSSGSFFHRPPSTILPSTQSRNLEPSGGYSLVITTQSLTSKPVEKDSVQLLLLKSTPSQLGVGNGVLPVERALQEAQVFTQELLRVAFQHYERDLLWSRLLFEDSDGPEIDVAHTLALPMDSFRVEVGPQQLEECLRLSICTPLGTLDPRLDELLNVSGVCWQELALRLRDIYSDQLREFEFQEEDKRSSHLLLLCPNTFDLIIHLTFITRVEHTRAEEAQESASGGSKSSSMNESRGSGTSALVYEDYVGKEAQGDMHVEICRREEPTNKQFTFAQRRSIAEFVNSIVHWQWRSLIYD